MNLAECFAKEGFSAKSSADTDPFAEVGKVALRFRARLFNRSGREAANRDSLWSSAFAAAKDAKRFDAAVGDAQLQTEDVRVVIGDAHSFRR